MPLFVSHTLRLHLFFAVETWLSFIIALHEELLGGMGQRQSRAPRAVQYRDLYDPQAPADGIGNLEPLRVVHALVLHGDVLGHLPQALLIMCLRTDVDQIRCDAGQTTLAVRAARSLLSFDKILVQFVHGALESVSIDPTLQFRGESGLEFDGSALAVVALHEHLHVVRLGRCGCSGLGHSHHIASHRLANAGALSTGANAHPQIDHLFWAGPMLKRCEILQNMFNVDKFSRSESVV